MAMIRNCTGSSHSTRYSFRRWVGGEHRTPRECGTLEWGLCASIAQRDLWVLRFNSVSWPSTEAPPASDKGSGDMTRER